MAVEFVAAVANRFNTTGSTFAGSLPSGATAGQVAVSYFAVFQQYADLLTVTPPSGWALLLDKSSARDEYGNDYRMLTAVRVLDGTEGKVTWETSVGVRALVATACYSGASISDPVGGSAGAVGHNASAPMTATAPATTTGKSGQVLYGYLGGTAMYFSTPAGTTQRLLSASAADGVPYLVVCDAAVNAGTAPAKTATDSQDAGDWIAFTIALQISNTAPNAPTLLTPATNAKIDRTVTNRFSWQFSDPDAGDLQSQYDLRYRLVGAGSWTTLTGITPTTYWDAPGATFTAGDYEWQVRTYDAQGLDGPYSSSGFFTAATPPAGPTITAPTNGATVDATATLTWSYPTQDSYQVQVLDGGGAVISDTGEVADAVTRSVPLSFPTNNTTRTLQVRVKYNGLWSAWVAVTVTVSYTPPPTPVLTLTPDPAHGAMLVAITNPAPGAGEAATAYNDLYVTDPGKAEERRATMLTPNTVWTYYTPPSGFDGVDVGRVRVEAVGSNGTRSST